PRLVHACLAHFYSMTASFLRNGPAVSQTSVLSLHDALPISATGCGAGELDRRLDRLRPGIREKDLVEMRHQREQPARISTRSFRSEEHTSELQSHLNLVSRLLLEKKTHRHV